jgi:hypothetical protein
MLLQGRKAAGEAPRPSDAERPGTTFLCTISLVDSGAPSSATDGGVQKMGAVRLGPITKMKRLHLLVLRYDKLPRKYLQSLN